MSKLARTPGIGVFALVFCALNIGDAAAQSTASPKASTSAPAVDSAAQQSAEAAKKSQILASDRWKQVEQQFAKWLSVQVVYTPAQVERMKAKLAAEVKNMSAVELQQFLDQWDAKLKILLGNDAGEAREWLGQNLSVIADGFRKQFLQELGITDVSQLTAAQIEDTLTKIRARRLQTQQQRAAFDMGRQQSLQMAQQFHADHAQSCKSLASQAAQFGTNQTPLAPRQYDFQPRPPLIPFFLW